MRAYRYTIVKTTPSGKVVAALPDEFGGQTFVAAPGELPVRAKRILMDEIARRLARGEGVPAAEGGPGKEIDFSDLLVSDPVSVFDILSRYKDHLETVPHFGEREASFLLRAKEFASLFAQEDDTQRPVSNASQKIDVAAMIPNILESKSALGGRSAVYTNQDIKRITEPTSGLPNTMIALMIIEKARNEARQEEKWKKRS